MIKNKKASASLNLHPKADAKDDALVSGLWDRHTILLITGRCKNLWAEICEKIVKKSKILTKKLL